jgi:hypothetical protein
VERGGPSPPGLYPGCYAEGMRSWAWAVLTSICLTGCSGGHRQLRQSVGPGPGPGCSTTLDCACKNGSAAACEQMGAVFKPPKPNPPTKPGPGPVVPPKAAEGLNEEEDGDPYDRCGDLYAKCMEQAKVANRRNSGDWGGSVCQQCFLLCRDNGYWPTRTKGGRKCPAVE